MRPYFRQAKSLGHLLQLSCKEWGSKTSHLVPTKGDFHPISYTELWARVGQYAKALQQLELKKGDSINIYSENSFDWALTDWAAQTLGVITVPIYPTLPSDQAQYIVKDSGAKIVFCGKDELKNRIGEMPGVKTILLSELKVMAESCVQDQAEWDAHIQQVSLEDVATIIYTSGTTGNPKGAVLIHGGIVDTIANIRESIELDENDTFLGFLPLSHVMERINGHFLPVGLGATLAYAQNLASIGNDILKVKPTVMLAVPRFLEAMRGRILDGVQSAPPIRQKLFKAALEQGTTKFRGGVAPLSGILDKLVGGKVRERLGGRFRFFVSGGAALPAHVAEFFGAFGIQILQGYGLTETTSGICVNRPKDSDYRTIGTPLKNIEMKIADDGEILIRGKCNMICYYNLPEDTAAAIDPEGWFHTGDIGEQLANGKYQITDRKKDLLVLGNGKNVAPQIIENKLKESIYIGEAVLFGDGMEYICGLIVPDFDRVKAYAEKAGIKTQSDEELILHEPIKKLIKSEIDRINKTLAPFEMVKKHVLLAKPFSLETGELTPSLKVKRRVVKENFKSEIASMMRAQ
ncbi:MAG: long-chain fatty acid--CoA ligase [Armatimonadetes bacterium]|nr:long-chain fatty acid--CoA ligase [Armatimonadota bacterium]